MAVIMDNTVVIHNHNTYNNYNNSRHSSNTVTQHNANGNYNNNRSSASTRPSTDAINRSSQPGSLPHRRVLLNNAINRSVKRSFSIDASLNNAINRSVKRSFSITRPIAINQSVKRIFSIDPSSPSIGSIKQCIQINGIISFNGRRRRRQKAVIIIASAYQKHSFL